MKNFKMVIVGLFTLMFLGNGMPQSFAQNKFCPAPPPLGDINKLTGDWIGSYTHDGKMYDLAVNLKVEKGELVATTMLPEFKILLTEFKTKICSSNEIHFSYTLPNDEIVEFCGRPKNEVFSGSFHLKKDPKVCTTTGDHFLLTRKRPLATNKE